MENNDEIKNEENRIHEEMKKLVNHVPEKVINNMNIENNKKKSNNYIQAKRKFKYDNTLDTDVKRYNSLLKKNPYTKHLRLINFMKLKIAYVLLLIIIIFLIINMFWFNINFSNKDFSTMINNTVSCPVNVPVNVTDNQIHNLYNNNNLSCDSNITVINYYNITTC